MEDLKRKGVVMEHVDGGIYLDLDDDWIYITITLKSLGMRSVLEIISEDEDEDEETNTDKDEDVEEITSDDDD